MHHSTLLAAAAMLLVPAAHAGGLYTKNSPVIQVTGKNYGKLIEKSPYTSIVEFYAPWCGHCKNLQPGYEKAAKKLEGLANVAAVNCDEDENKQFCGSMGVQGFPTLKIVRPSKKATGKPVTEDYRGERSAKGIVNAVTSAINNHVKRLQDKDRDEFMLKEGPKALLFSDKSTVSATIKTIAIDFLDLVSVAQVRDTQKGLVDEFGVTQFPTLILIPQGGDAVVYDGEMKKEAMVEFLSQVGDPRAAGGAKKDKKEKKEKKEKPKSKSKKPESDPDLESDPEPEAEASAEPEKPQSPIPVSSDPSEVSKECLDVRSHTCILAFVPDPPGEEGAGALNQLAEIYAKHKHANRKLFSAFILPKGNTAGDHVMEHLQLPSAVELIAINARRGWWRHFNGVENGFTHEAIEAWIDEIRMGDGQKLRIPPGIVLGILDEDPFKPKDQLPSQDSTGSETATAEEKAPAEEVPVEEVPEEKEMPVKEVPKEKEAEEMPGGHEEL